MSRTEVMTSYVETPVYFQAGDDHLFGMVTMPREGGARTGFIILTGAGTPLSVNRNRMSVRLCRELAAIGYAGLRMDYHGVGDSTGAIDEFRLDQPFAVDAAAAVGCLKRMGVEKVILAGSCFGARTALASAAEIDDVEAVVLIASALRDYALGERKAIRTAQDWSLAKYAREGLRPSNLRGLFHARTRRTYLKYLRSKIRLMIAKLPGGRRLTRKPTAVETVSPSFERPLRKIVKRGVHVRFIYGDGDGFYQDEYVAAAAGPLADVLDERRGIVEVSVLSGRLHGFTTVATQDAVVEDILRWAAAWRARDGGTAIDDDETPQRD
jgi:pimeloyl-ACP methyl ester carboxylesterase